MTTGLRALVYLEVFGRDPSALERFAEFRFVVNLDDSRFAYELRRRRAFAPAEPRAHVERDAVEQRAAAECGRRAAPG